MRFAPIGLIALTVTVGCVRLGYDALHAPIDPKTDASDHDAGSKDAAPVDAAPPADAEPMDASEPMRDAAPADGGGTPQDSGMHVPIDAGSTDSGSMDSGSMDGGSMDSGSMDGGSMDGGPDAAPVDHCPEIQGALFCDDFEDSSLSGWTSSSMVNGMAAYSTAQANSGDGSLRATTGASGSKSSASYGMNVFEQQMSGEIWLRYYLFIPNSTVIDAAFSSGLVGDNDTSNSGFYLLIRPTGVDISTGNMFYRTSIVFPREEWVCVELHVEIDAVAGAYELWLDEVRRIRTGMPTDTLPDMGYTKFEVGISHTDSGQGPLEIFVDDVVAATERVGCD